MAIFIEYILTFLTIMFFVWLVLTIFKYLRMIPPWVSYQARMLKHRPRLWWQLHKPYKSYDDHWLEIDVLASIDMSRKEFDRYLARLSKLRKKVYGIDRVWRHRQ